MSNFQCPHCGMVNIDCGKNGYKTPKELKYESALGDIKTAVYNPKNDFEDLKAEIKDSLKFAFSEVLKDEQ